jgi:hypothetical protein
VKGDTLFFSASRNGQDKLMAWDDGGRKLFEVLDSYTGIQQAAPLATGLLYIAHHLRGVLCCILQKQTTGKLIKMNGCR